MLEVVKTELREYQEYYEEWKEKVGMTSVTPTAVGWKVAGYNEFVNTLEELLPKLPQAHIADVDDRKIGAFVLNEPLPMGIRVVKLMQRRSGSNDPVGLDHVDFTSKDMKAVEDILQRHGVVYEWESNVAHEWISARIIGDREAKFFDHTVLDIGAKELTEESVKLLENKE